LAPPPQLGNVTRAAKLLRFSSQEGKQASSRAVKADLLIRDLVLQMARCPAPTSQTVLATRASSLRPRLQRAPCGVYNLQ
jgi:hypothetical protein